MADPTQRPADAPPPTGALPLVDLARVVGGYRWLEARLFEVLGGWVPSTPEPPVKVLLDAHAHQHAWHAELWLARLPELRELGPDEVTGPATPALADALGQVAALEGSVPRLAAVHRVLLPRLVTTYADHQARTAPVADAAVARALRLVVADEEVAWREGEAALQALLVDPADVAAAAEAVGRVEALVVAAGGVGGPAAP